MDPAVGVDADQVVVEGGVVDLGQGEAVDEHRLAQTTAPGPAKRDRVTTAHPPKPLTATYFAIEPEENDRGL
jgi:hypothetical protein